MWGGGYPGGSGFERMTDNWIQHNVPGGLNSALGERLDNFLGGNSNPTWGQVYGGAPGVGGFGGGFPGAGGGFPGYGGGYGYSYQGW